MDRVCYADHYQEYWESNKFGWSVKCGRTSLESCAYLQKSALLKGDAITAYVVFKSSRQLFL